MTDFERNNLSIDDNVVICIGENLFSGVVTKFIDINGIKYAEIKYKFCGSGNKEHYVIKSAVLSSNKIYKI